MAGTDLSGRKYKAYTEYQNSDIDWLRKIPNYWQTIPLRLILNTRKGVAFKSNDFTSVGIRVVKASDIKKLTINSSEVYLPTNYISIYPKAILRKGDIILSTVGSNPNVKNSAVGQIGIVPEHLDGTLLNQNTVVFEPKEDKIHREFLFKVIQMNGYRDHLDLNAHGTANQSSLSISDMLNFYIPIPPKNEQQKIASFLDHETAKIDTLIAKQEKLIELLKEKRQAVISHAVTKGLNPNAPMRDSGVEWLGEVPVHWVVAGFKKFIEKIVDYRGKTPNKTDSGVFLVTARNIKKGVVDYSLSNEFISEDDYSETMSRGKPNIGDVLFTTEAPLGEVANVDNTDIALAQRIIKFSGKKDILDNYFFKYFMMSEAFQTSLSLYASGSTVKGIKAERLVYLRKLIPPLAEQKEITHHIDIELKKFDLLVSKAEVGIELIKERKTALISAAVTGKIDIRDWKF